MTVLAEAHPVDLHTRAATIAQLLERHADLVEPGNGREAGAGIHVAIGAHSVACAVLRTNPPVCTCWRRDLDEVERLLRVMRGDRHRSLLRVRDRDGKPTGERASVRRCWWHVNAWYVQVRWVMFQPPLQQGRRRKPIKLAVDQFGRVLPVRVARRDAGAREDLAELGVWWMAEHWAPLREPRLPAEEAA